VHIAIACLLASITPAHAEPIVSDPTTPAYHCRRAQGPIVVDGNLDEQAWAYAPVTRPFVFPWPDQKGAKQMTQARLLWDDNCLYVAYECKDRDITAEYLEHDDPVYKDDCVEIFIAPDPQKSRFYFGFEMNCRGVLYDYFFAIPDAFIAFYETGGVQLKTRIYGTVEGHGADATSRVPTDTDEGWTLELAIPFANFQTLMPGERPKPGDTWRINLNRWDGVGDVRALSEWSPSGQTFADPHRPEGFGALVFDGE
jgi:hypothetical protein